MQRRDPMPNRNQNGRNTNTPDEQRPRFRPHDPSARDDRSTSRDPHDEGHPAVEQYGQGQSGYGSGRYGEDRSLGFENRNQSYGGRGGDDRQQQQGMGIDERFASRGGQGYYQGGGQGIQVAQGAQGYGRQEEGLGHRGFGEGERGFGGAENRGYSSGYNQGGFGGHGDPQRDHDRAGDGGAGQGRSGGQSSQGETFRSGQWGQGHQGAGSTQTFNTMGPHGQRGQHRGKGPQGWQRSDERIREMICEALTDDEHIDASHIDIVVTNGEVTLTGTVSDRAMKRMAEDIVERLSGVHDVTNQLKVGRQDRGNPSIKRGVATTEPETAPDRSKHRA